MLAGVALLVQASIYCQAKTRQSTFSCLCALVIPACLGLGMSSFQLGRLRMLKGASLMFGIATIEEFSQLWIASRTFDWLDLCCNYLGIACFTLLLLRVFHRRSL